MESKCRECGKIGNHRVTDSRGVGAIDSYQIRRRKECPHCGKRYTTYELHSEHYGPLKELSEFRELFGTVSVAAEIMMLFEHIGNLSKRFRNTKEDNGECIGEVGVGRLSFGFGGHADDVTPEGEDTTS